MKLIITITIILIGLVLSVRDKTVTMRLYFVIFCSLLIIAQITFRDINYDMSSSNDTVRYYYHFQEVQTTSFSEIISKLFSGTKEYSERNSGYEFIVKLFQFFSTDFVVFLFFTAMIGVVPLSKIIYRYSNSIISITLSYVIFEFFFESFFETGIRQIIALGIVLSGYSLLVKNKVWKYLIVIIIASKIHTTALVFLPIIVYKHIKNIKSLLIVSILSIPFLMLYSDIIVAIIGQGSIYESYLIESKDNLGTPNYSLFVIILTLLFCYVFKEFKRGIKDYKILTVCIIATLLLMPLSWINSNLLRLSFYYSFFYVVLIPIVFRLLSAKVQFSYNTICISAMLLLFTMMI